MNDYGDYNESNFDVEGFLFYIKICLVFVLSFSVGNHFVQSFWLDGKVFAGLKTESLEMSKQLSDINKRQVANVNTLSEAKEKSAHFATTTTTSSSTIRLGFVGDIMLDRNIERVATEGVQRDFNFPFYYISEKLKEYDILFGNLEGPVSDKGHDLGSLYSFRMDPDIIPVLKKKGFDVLSVANNHSGDWGGTATSDTFTRLQEGGIEYVGGGFTEEQAYDYKIVEFEGVKFAYAAFSQFGRGYLEAKGGNAGIAIISKEKIKDVVERARAEADVVILSYHFGDEYETVQNSYQEDIAEYSIDLGADLVIGHHPHVAQPLVRYKDGYIIYSLGNFIFDQNFSEDTKNGAMLEVLLDNKKITDVKKLKIEFTDSFQPFLVE